jgi:hypothetical protein
MMNTRSLICVALAVVSAIGLSSCNLIAPLVRTALPLAGIKMAMACLPQEAMIDTPAGPRAVRDITAGDVVTGYRGHPVIVQQKHDYLEQASTVFIKVVFDDGASVEACGRHRLAGTRLQDLEIGQGVAGRRVTALSTRCGIQRSYDLLTEDEGYRIDGVQVNSMIEEMHAAAAGLPRDKR